MSAERATLIADLVKLRYDHFGVDNWPKAIATIQRAIEALSQSAPEVVPFNFELWQQGGWVAIDPSGRKQEYLYCGFNYPSMVREST